MARRRRPSMRQTCNQTGQGSRHTPLDQKVALERTSIWVKWIITSKDVATRDEKRIHQAFRLLLDENKTDAYTVAVRQAHNLGGKALAAILALSIGKSAFRDMRQKLKQELPTILAGKRFHLLGPIRNYVRKIESHLAPEDEDDCSNFEETNSAVAALSNESEALDLDGLTASQPVSFTSQWQYQTELTGNVYELDPTDLLEFATGLITKKISCPGPLLLTEPFNPLAKPFFTVPITTNLCFDLRNRRRQVM